MSLQAMLEDRPARMKTFYLIAVTRKGNSGKIHYDLELADSLKSARNDIDVCYSDNECRASRVVREIEVPEDWWPELQLEVTVGEPPITHEMAVEQGGL